MAIKKGTIDEASVFLFRIDGIAFGEGLGSGLIVSGKTVTHSICDMPKKNFISVMKASVEMWENDNPQIAMDAQRSANLAQEVMFNGQLCTIVPLKQAVELDTLIKVYKQSFNTSDGQLCDLFNRNGLDFGEHFMWTMNGNPEMVAALSEHLSRKPASENQIQDWTDFVKDKGKDGPSGRKA